MKALIILSLLSITSFSLQAGECFITVGAKCKEANGADPKDREFWYTASMDDLGRPELCSNRLGLSIHTKYEAFLERNRNIKNECRDGRLDGSEFETTLFSSRREAREYTKDRIARCQNSEFTQSCHGNIEYDVLDLMKW